MAENAKKISQQAKVEEKSRPLAKGAGKTSKTSTKNAKKAGDAGLEYISLEEVKRRMLKVPGMPASAAEAVTAVLFLCGKHPPRLLGLLRGFRKVSKHLSQWLLDNGGPKVLGKIRSIEIMLDEKLAGAGWVSIPAAQMTPETPAAEGNDQPQGEVLGKIRAIARMLDEHLGAGWVSNPAVQVMPENPGAGGNDQPQGADESGSGTTERQAGKIPRGRETGQGQPDNGNVKLTVGEQETRTLLMIMERPHRCGFLPDGVLEDPRFELLLPDRKHSPKRHPNSLTPRRGVDSFLVLARTVLVEHGCSPGLPSERWFGESKSLPPKKPSAVIVAGRVLKLLVPPDRANTGKRRERDSLERQARSRKNLKPPSLEKLSAALEHVYRKYAGESVWVPKLKSQSGKPKRRPKNNQHSHQ